MTSSLAVDASPDWFRMEGVTRWYGGVRALTDASFGVAEGEVHGIVGPNGAGKSTMVKIIAGVEQPDAGTILIDGVEHHFSSPALAQKNRIVMMPQEISLVPDADLVSNIMLGAEPLSRGMLHFKRARDRARDAMAMIELDIDPSTHARNLSTVHKRLLMLARAVDRQARLLILDEPTAGLAGHEARLVTDTVARLVAAGVTVIYISHHLTEVAELCDRVTAVREGRVVTTVAGADVTKSALVDMVIGGIEIAPDKPTEAHVADRTEREAGLTFNKVCGTRVRDVSFVAPHRSVTGIAGLLGSGVAELVAFAAGAAKPTSGTMNLRADTVAFTTPADALDAGVGYLAGDRSIAAFPQASVRENVTVSALRRWTRWGIVPRRRERAATEQALAALEVKGDPEARISSLSGGNQQRALVGRLIAADVGCVVLDDPTVGVDIHARESLWTAVRNLATSHTVILASSEPDELVALCDQVICLKGGEISAVLRGPDVSVSALTHAVT